MKLRDKETGKVRTFDFVVISDDYRRDGELTKLSSSFPILVCRSIEQLNEEWENYKPKEPLIKDEKVRKAVRAWAEANDIERVWHEYSSNWLRGNGLEIELENEVVELEQGNYSIAELCGEESPEPLEPSFVDLDERIKEKVASEKLYKGENDMHLTEEDE